MRVRDGGRLINYIRVIKIESCPAKLLQELHPRHQKPFMQYIEHVFDEGAGRCCGCSGNAPAFCGL